MLTGVGGRAGTARGAGGPAHRARSRWRAWRVAGVVAGIVVLLYCAQREASQFGVQSDGAAMVLESWAMLHGNLLLHGWHLSDVSFYTTELPEYMLVELVRGMNPDVVRFCAAITYTLLVVLAAAVAHGARPTAAADGEYGGRAPGGYGGCPPGKGAGGAPDTVAVSAIGRAPGRAAWGRAGIAVMVMLGPSVAAASTLLNDPDHTGTAVPILLALLILDRAAAPGGSGGCPAGQEAPDARPTRWRFLPSGAHRAWAPVAVAVVLGWALVGDSIVLLIGVAPLVLVCGARAFGRLAIRRTPLADAWYDLAMTAAGVAAALAGTAADHLIAASGGYVVSPQITQYVVGSPALPANAATTTANFLNLFSANFFGARLDHRLALTGVHLVFACLVAVALVLALSQFRRLLDGDLIAELLAAAIVINLLAYLLLYPGSTSTGREIAPVFGLGGALAGRMLGEPALRRRLEPLLGIGAVAAIAVLIAALVSVKPQVPASSSLARFLVSQHLRNGLSGYWNADSTTMDSGGRVVMRTVRFSQGHGLAAYPWEIDTRLLNSRANNVNFLVATAPGSHQAAAVTPAEAIAQFGRPYRSYKYQGYVIMVWHKNLLAQLGSVLIPG